MTSTAELLYKPYRFHPQLFNNNFLESWLHTDYISILNAFQKLPPPAELDDTFNIDNVVSQDLLKKEMDGVNTPLMYSTLPLFNYSMKRLLTFILYQNNIISMLEDQIV